MAADPRRAAHGIPQEDQSVHDASVQSQVKIAVHKRIQRQWALPVRTEADAVNTGMCGQIFLSDGYVQPHKTTFMYGPTKTANGSTSLCSSPVL